MTGVRTQRPVQALGRKGGDEDQTWAVKVKRYKEGRGTEGKNVSEGAEVKTALQSPGGGGSGGQGQFGRPRQEVVVSLTKF